MKKPAYLLDTNIVSLALKGRSSVAVARLKKVPRSKVAISVITEMELRFGVAKHPAPHEVRQTIEEFLATIPVANLPEDIASVYGSLRAELEARGKPIGPLDTIIAAHAIAARAILVTNNGREFGRVRGLRWEDWTA
ncbi:MAG: PIN domain-containing protein [Myxococcota bacterium]